VTIVNEPSPVAAGALDQHRIEDQIRQRPMWPEWLEAGLLAVGTHSFDHAQMPAVVLAPLTAIAAHRVNSVRLSQAGILPACDLADSEIPAFAAIKCNGLQWMSKWVESAEAPGNIVRNLFCTAGRDSIPKLDVAGSSPVARS
jgi:hypothetical protein